MRSGDSSDQELNVALAGIVDRVLPKLPQLAARIAEDYAKEFEEYARLLPEAREQTIQSSFANLRALVSELAPDNPAVPAYDTAAFERTGAVRLRMGISIDTLMRSFNVWGQRAWDFFRAEVDMTDPQEVRALFMISDRIFWHVDRATASMAKGYMREASSGWTDREMTRFAVLEALVTGRIDAEELRQTRDSPKLSSAYTPICLRRRASHELIFRSTNDYVREIGRIANPAGPAGKVLVGSHQGDPFVLWPSGPPAAHLDRLLELLRDGFPELAIGAAQESENLSTVEAEYKRARLAAQLADALESPEPLHHSELRLELAIARSAELQSLGADALSPLQSYDAKRGAGLIETLTAYITSGCSIPEAAKLLYVHPNTVVYRLKRVAEVSGHDPREARGLLTLSVAILSTRLAGFDVN